MRTIDSELERASESLHELASRLPDREWRKGWLRIPKPLAPLVTAIAVLALVGVPTLLWGGFVRIPVSNTGTPTDTLVLWDETRRVYLVPTLNRDAVGDEGAFESVSVEIPYWGADRPVVYAYLRTASVPLGQSSPPDATIEVGEIAGAGPRDWATRQVIPTYEDGQILIRGGRVATLLRDLETDRLVAIRWTEMPDVQVLVSSFVFDVVALAEAIEWQTVETVISDR